MNPRAEAFDRLRGEYEVRVLEPSPPAISEPPWFADDPAARGVVPDGRRLVSPVGAGDLRWEEAAAGDDPLAQWCADRWLGPYRRLAPLPTGFGGTRTALHRVAEGLLKPAREAATGKFGLRYTHGGFGTPFFGSDVQIRVAHGELIVQTAGTEQRAPITTLADGAQLLGDLLPEVPPEPDAQLQVHPAAATALGDWYGFTTSVLEELRAASATEEEASRVQLWPEHFDIAVELGAEGAGRRAGYGGSPGDEQHPEPYLYVTPWTARPEGELWNAAGFAGAELSYADLLESDDQRSRALEFFRTRLDALNTMEVAP